MRIPLVGLVVVGVWLAVGCSDDGSAGSGGGADGGVAASGDAGGLDRDGDGLVDAREAELGTDPGNADSDGDGFTDAQEVELGTDPSVQDEGCAGSSAGTTMEGLPVDVILVVDNSSSMDGEIEAIVQRINVDFAQILADSGVDYRLILLSRHGALEHGQNSCDDHGICIGPPLAAGACDPNAPPGNTDRFKHYSVCIDSNDGLRKTMDAFEGGEQSGYFNTAGDLLTLDDAPGGWSEWLRAGAQRSFLVITDDQSEVNAQQFTRWLYAQESRYFGTEDAPNWKFHSIVGLRENTPEEAAWQPGDGQINGTCQPGSEGNGDDYQDLSIESGGLRFPICRNDNFDALFRSIATTVAQGSIVPCSFAPAPAPGQGEPDFSRVVVIYDAGDGTRSTLQRVADASECGVGDFYVDANQRIILCPDRCDIISADDGAALRTRVACGGEVIF